MPTQEDRADLPTVDWRELALRYEPPASGWMSTNDYTLDQLHALAASSTGPEGARSVIDTYVKLHEGKIGAHWIWCVIEQIAAGVPEPEAMRAYGYYEPAAISAETPEPAGQYSLGEVFDGNSLPITGGKWIELNAADHFGFAFIIWQMSDGDDADDAECQQRARAMVAALNSRAASMEPAAAPEAVSEREAFEAHTREACPEMDLALGGDGYYRTWRVEQDWRLWQASRSTSTQAAAKSAAPAAVALDDESDRSENWLSCKGEQRAATPTGASMEPVAFTDVERSMVGFCMSQMDGLSDSEWRAHGFRRSTFERAENKMQTILTASASPTTQEGTK